MTCIKNNNHMHIHISWFKSSCFWNQGGWTLSVKG